MRGMTSKSAAVSPHIRISIHIPHARDDGGEERDCEFADISIHIPHARDDQPQPLAMLDDEISIHIPHARDDSIIFLRMSVGNHFNPHPSCEG